MLKNEFPWARFYDLRSPVQFDELGDVLEEIWAAHSPHRQDGDRMPAEERIIGESSAIRIL
ncbi:MAG TPA: hypothetical protein VNQ14_15900, partial [Woeseiaceae bacterium]|nr:hypothetical protein [Woeseiaceae bacterium]